MGRHQHIGLRCPSCTKCEECDCFVHEGKPSMHRGDCTFLSRKRMSEVRATVHAVLARLDAGPTEPAEWEVIASQLRQAANRAEEW